MVYLLLEKECCRWDDRSMDRLSAPCNNPKSAVRRKRCWSNKSRIYLQVFEVLGLRNHGRTIKNVWTEASNSEWQLSFSLRTSQDIFLGSSLTHYLSHTDWSGNICSISDGMWFLQKEKSWQSQSDKPASRRACPIAPGAHFPPPVTGTNCSCLLTTIALLAAVCKQQRRHFPLSAPTHYRGHWEEVHREALSWQMVRSHTGYLDVFSRVQDP